MRYANRDGNTKLMLYLENSKITFTEIIKTMIAACNKKSFLRVHTCSLTRGELLNNFTNVKDEKNLIHEHDL